MDPERRDFTAHDIFDIFGREYRGSTALAAAPRALTQKRQLTASPAGYVMDIDLATHIDRHRWGDSATHPD